MTREERAQAIEEALMSLGEKDNTGRLCWCVHDGWAQHSHACKAARAALALEVESYTEKERRIFGGTGEP